MIKWWNLTLFLLNCYKELIHVGSYLSEACTKVVVKDTLTVYLFYFT